MWKFEPLCCFGDSHAVPVRPNGLDKSALNMFTTWLLPTQYDQMVGRMHLGNKAKLIGVSETLF